MPTLTPTPSPSNTAPVAPTATFTPTPSPPAPEATPDIDIIVDNRDPAFSVTGTWFVGDGGQSYQGDCHWAPRGIQNIASVQPGLPVAGAYEVLAWWCGDPDHNQSRRVLIQVYPSSAAKVPHQVHVNLQEDAGQWNSLGTYNLGQDSSLSVNGNLSGNVVADAFRFVYRSAEPTVITPTPLPTDDPTTHYPPSPLEQLTSGDLSARLGLVQRFYPYTPIVAREETTFDDCQAFPRDGCGGSRAGWRVQVQVQDMVVGYRVSDNYWYVAIEPPDSLASRQLLYLRGTGSNGLFRVDRYPDNTWHLSSAGWDLMTGSHIPLDAETVGRLQRFVQTYSSLEIETPSGIRVTLYGLGARVRLSEEDQGRLETLAEELAAAVW
jgi:hypothetical protein